MMNLRMKQFFGGVVVVLVLFCGLLAWWSISSVEEAAPAPSALVTDVSKVEPATFYTETTIGQSVEGRAVTVTTFGTGTQQILFVGGIHGGYEWNSALLAYQMIDYLIAHREVIPASLSISIIPVLNPDGLYQVTKKNGRFTLADVADPSTRIEAARFNAQGVDLNRNFDCKWQPESNWRGRSVSAGTAAFSEPEAAALRDFVLASDITAAVFWQSKANTVFASECEAGVLPETLTLMRTYAQAANYAAAATFDAYPITGDAEGWLARVGIPAVTVELESHDSTEWERNLSGVKAILDLYTTQLPE